MRSWRIDRVLLFWVAAAAVLLLWNLGNGCLWQDEAETGFLAKNILQFGYPRATDGINELSPLIPRGPGQSWIYHSWLSFYTAAVSMGLFGVNTVAARLPFALMAVGAVALAYRMVRQLTQSVPLARWTCGLMVLNVPWLLHMRQCRYYAPSVLLSLWTVSAYWRLLNRGRGAVAELGVALVLLFHFNHGIFLPIAVTLALHGLLIHRDRTLMPAFWKTAAIVLPLTLPFLVLLQAQQHHAAFAGREVSRHAQFYFRQINHYVFPVTFWLVLLPFWRPSRARLFGPPGSPARAAIRFLVLFLIVNFLFFCVGPTQRHFRYLIHLLPFFFLLQAFLIRHLISRSRWLGIGALLIMTLTDLHYVGPPMLAGKPDRPRCLPWEFAGELTHPYRGPMDGVVELLNREGKPGQTVKIPYETYPIFFYTPLQVESLLRIEDFTQPTFPDWIVLQRDWLPKDFARSDYFDQIQAAYEPIVLDAPDLPWQNRPDPGYHKFRTDRSAPPVLVFRKRN